VLVIGGGNAGLCAAIVAAEAGADVVIIDVAPRTHRGGNSRHTRNLRCMHEQPTNVLTEAYPEQELWEDLLRVTGGETNEDLARLMIRQSADCTDWMHQHGVRFQPPLGGTLHLGRTNAFFLGGGKALVNAYYRAAEQLGMRAYYDTPLLDLTIEDGRCSGVEVLFDGVPSTIAAKAVVAAAGGFEANIDWLKEHWGDTADNFLIRGTPYNTGTMLKALLDGGVQAVGDPKQCHAVAIDGRAPKFDGGIVTRVDCVAFGVVVNNLAERFYDEGEDFWPKRYAIWGRLVADQPDQIGHVIIDSKAIGHFMPPVFEAIESDTLSGLAEKLGLDPARFASTISNFNAACRPGTFDPTILDGCHTDRLTPPKSHWARPIDTPPYYAYSLRPGITFTYLGVKVDDQARMVMANGAAAKNLFAAGEIMAGNVLGKGYLAGIGMTIGTVFGRIAGKAAADHALQ